MRAWLNENYVSLVCLLIFLAFAVVVVLGRPVAAAPVDVEDCTPIAKLGLIVLARCVDPDTGEEIYMNSVGFIRPPKPD